MRTHSSINVLPLIGCKRRNSSSATDRLPSRPACPFRCTHTPRRRRDASALPRGWPSRYGVVLDRFCINNVVGDRTTEEDYYRVIASLLDPGGLFLLRDRGNEDEAEAFFQLLTPEDTSRARTLVEFGGFEKIHVMSITSPTAALVPIERIFTVFISAPINPDVRDLLLGHVSVLDFTVFALETDDPVIETALEVAHRMRKETVIVREAPGFITSRINAMIGNEAFYLLQEGIASARDIDKALKLGLNHPMGPFELVDLVGLDTRLSILEYLHRTLGEKYRPAPLLVQYVKAGRLGKKVGLGVYEYDVE